ncbi:MAG: tetratricopeptide repeat protein [Pseudomonadota bacterium]
MIRLLLCVMLFIGFAVPSMSQTVLGHYLAGNSAIAKNDFKTADQRYQQALALDPNASEVLGNAILPALINDDFPRALEYAQRLDALSLQSDIEDLVLIVDAIDQEDYVLAQEILDRAGDQFLPILPGLLKAWVALGRGSVTEAVAHLDMMTEPLTAELFAQFHKAFILAAVGDFETADRLLTGDERGNLRLTDGAILAHIQIMSELGERDRALILHDSIRRNLPPEDWSEMRRRILSDNESYGYITTAKEGVAKAFTSLAVILDEVQDPTLTLALAKIGQYLRPNNANILFIAETFVAQEQYPLALREYDKIGPAAPEFVDAEFGRSDTLVAAGQPEAAIEVMRALERQLPGDPRLAITTGDIYRGNNQCAEAVASYDRAIDAIERFRQTHWFVFHARAVCQFELDNWTEAEAGFRRALELSPNRATVLNYLGYSLVERQEKLDEAQDMIRRAAQLRPDSGAIADSLGWVYYRLGKYEDAVEPMEKAVALLPTDPIVNDHLGDVYWKVERMREAEFQWQRALSFGPDEGLAARIRAKLDRGLDAVLAEEAKSAQQTSAN